MFDDDKEDAENYRLLQADALLSRFYKVQPEAAALPPQDEQMKIMRWLKNERTATSPIQVQRL
jgi:hypothetical protein